MEGTSYNKTELLKPTQAPLNTNDSVKQRDKQPPLQEQSITTTLDQLTESLIKELDSIIPQQQIYLGIECTIIYLRNQLQKIAKQYEEAAKLKDGQAETTTERKNKLAKQAIETITNFLQLMVQSAEEGAKTEELNKLIEEYTNIGTILPQPANALKEKEDKARIDKQEEKKTEEEDSKQDLKDTFSNYLDEYFENNDVTLPLSDQQLTTLLRNYINNDITKYLALMIQANYEQITYKAKQNKPDSITAERIYYLLYNEITSKTRSKPRTKEESTIINNETHESLSKFYSYLSYKKDNTASKEPTEDKILLLLFLPATEVSAATPQEALNKLKELTPVYTNDDKEPPVGPNEPNILRNISDLEPGDLNFLSNLYTVAERLDREHVYQTKSNSKGILNQIAKIVREFSTAYNKKLITQQNNKKQVLTAKIIANLKSTTEKLSKIINILLL